MEKLDITLCTSCSLLTGVFEHEHRGSKEVPFKRVYTIKWQTHTWILQVLFSVQTHLWSVVKNETTVVLHLTAVKISPMCLSLTFCSFPAYATVSLFSSHSFLLPLEKSSFFFPASIGHVHWRILASMVLRKIAFLSTKKNKSIIIREEASGGVGEEIGST